VAYFSSMTTAIFLNRVKQVMNILAQKDYVRFLVANSGRIAAMMNLETIAKQVGELEQKSGRSKGLPPVQLWHPPFCGDIDMRIASDGSWYYMGTPIGRPAMVRLFSTILRRDPDRYVLVTPVEMVGIRVDDAPFIAVELLVEKNSEGLILNFRTNVDDWTAASELHPIRFELEAAGGLKPYVMVRNDLWAKVTRALYYELIGLAVTREIDGVAMLGLGSHGAFFPMAPASDFEEVI
jgi:uncharacterized protein